LRVFGSPAQIFVRPTARSDKKLSDRSVSGTLVGISDKGNGYIFLVNKSDSIVEIDSKDAKFNETFSEYRGKQGKITAANHIEPDLRDESSDNNTAVINTDDDDNSENETNDKRRVQFSLPTEKPKLERPTRQTTPRQFLLPGTHSEHEIEIRKQQ
jgi:hypothetical protein